MMFRKAIALSCVVGFATNTAMAQDLSLDEQKAQAARSITAPPPPPKPDPEEDLKRLSAASSAQQLTPKEVQSWVASLPPEEQQKQSNMAHRIANKMVRLHKITKNFNQLQHQRLKFYEQKFIEGKIDRSTNVKEKDMVLQSAVELLQDIVLERKNLSPIEDKLAYFIFLDKMQ